MPSDFVHSCTCPACACHVAVSFYDGGNQPLCTIAWPESAEVAQSMPRLPLSFVRCADCGHVYNKDFDYAHVPYSDKPNLMYNRAPIWSEHLRKVRDLILVTVPENPVVVEIGCGEGHLLRALAEARPSGRYIGFDPNGAVDVVGGKVETRKELFDPAVHLEECRPDMVVSRHVLEHLMNPRGFLERLAFCVGWLGMEVQIFHEVPCIDRVFATGRIADFYYEHNSHFTTTSFHKMFGQAASEVSRIEHGYDGEVIYGIGVLRGSQSPFAIEALQFRDSAKQARETIERQLLDLSRKKVAIWGGTGKGAAFINYFGLDAKRFPLVVDSDIDKAGTFVPGTGQKIVYRDELLAHQLDVVIIPTQWRAKDIVAEMGRCSILSGSVLIEHLGRLVDYYAEEHPYK